MRKISLIERSKVCSIADAMLYQGIARSRREYITEDMAGLCKEIYISMGGYSHLFTAYRRLLSAERYLYNPEDAYVYGQLHAEDNNGYLRSIALAPETEDYYGKLQFLYNLICGVLKTMGCQGLIREYTDEYRDVFGNVMQNIEFFVQMGRERVNGKRKT